MGQQRASSSGGSFWILLCPSAKWDNIYLIKSMRARDTAQWHKLLPHMHKLLSPIPGTKKTKEQKQTTSKKLEKKLK